MSSWDDLKATYFDECAELLQDLEGGLGSIRDGTSDDETIHAVFRAVHSIKGGAGAFGFETLVEFAHVFETVLDAMRRGDLEATEPVVETLLSANDVLADLVSMAQSDQQVPADLGAETRRALERLIGAEGGGEGDDEPIADFEGIDFMPVMAGDADEQGGGERTYLIRFRPNPDLFRNAHEPLPLLRELGRLGQLTLEADVSALPSLAEIEPDRSYLAWSAALRSAAPQSEIEEIFDFVRADSELEITEDGAPQPAVDIDISDLIAATADAGSEEAPAAPGEPAEAGAPRTASAKGPGRRDGEAAPAKSTAPKPSASIRVDLNRIDRVVNMVGELVIAQAMLGQVVQELPEDASVRLSQILDEVLHHTRELKDSVMSIRAQPVRSVFQRMPRLVREVSGKTGKKVHLEMIGEATEVDKTIIERLSDPLTHILRNSIDHGIEAPADRAAAGKPETGTIHLSADHRGGRIVIEISDDGAGINRDRVFKKACEKGLVAPDSSLSDDEINNLIFMPGFSTAEIVSDVSGRGVGMDVVRSNIQDLGGRITVRSQPGQGTSIQLALPLTLAVMDGMVVKGGGETYVIPISTVVECLRPRREALASLAGRGAALQLRGQIVPLVHIRDLLGVALGEERKEENVVLITDVGDGVRVGIAVDELLGQQQVVIKSIEENFHTVPGIAAATILGNGEVAFILDIEQLINLVAERGQGPSSMLAQTHGLAAVA